ncbi:hypothetical protein ACFRMQ_16405 [Kitasatospora sp. NPDC056783]|uniref:hypothetical protein n=1 Tax=Kitasatospora sp. NPDC056783 TaxID=3345943 RepID=UPI0036BDAF33
MTDVGRTVHPGLTIAITGTRQTESRHDVLAELFERVLAPFADVPAADRGWLLGGAAGVDTSALRFLAGRDAGRLVVAVPVRCADQPADAREAIEQAHAAGRVERIVELDHPEGIGAAAFTARNRWLVDHSDLVIGFPLTGTDDGSGTWETLAYAAGLGRPYLVAPLS